jgi:hypothetical protein
MVEKIIWTEDILFDIKEILLFWEFYNKSNVYSNKLL